MKLLLHNNVNDAIQQYNLTSPELTNTAGVTCEDENILIGYLYYTTNRFHPHSIYLHFNFLIKNPNVDILTKMFQKLKSRRSNYNYILNVENNYSFYKTFINDNSFIKIRKTYEPEISIDNLIYSYNYIDCLNYSTYPPIIITDKLL